MREMLLKRVSLSALLTLSLMLFTPDVRLSAELKIDQWSQTAPIEIKQFKKGGVVEFALTPEVLDGAKADLGDLRIVTNIGVEIGYKVETKYGSDRKVPLTAKLYNRVHIPNKESSVNVDFESKTLKNKIEITTPGTNFRRRVSVEGSDDGESWQIIRGDAFLFRVKDKEEKGPIFDKKEIRIPDNDFRKLRITIFNGADDPEVVEISDVKAWQHSRIPPEATDVPIVSAKVEEKKRATDVLLDLGFRNLPLNSIKLEFSDINFFRRARVYGRNSETRVVRTRSEDSPAGTKTVNVPWTSVGEGRLYRFSGQSGTEESLTLKLDKARFRYLRVEILNGDDPPLEFTFARATRLVPRIVMTSVETGTPGLYFGNPKASKPSYDMVHYVEKLRRAGVGEATLGKPVPNPFYKSGDKPPPWSERHKAIIWVALLAMAAVLGYLVYRMAISAKTEASQ